MANVAQVLSLPSIGRWSTPMTIGAFILMSCTGVLMFFEQESLGIITIVHQWFSWLFLLGAGGHITANFSPFKKHLGTRRGKMTISAFLLVFSASLFSWGLITGPQLERPIEQALVNAPLSALANVVQISPEILQEKLQNHGINAETQQTILDIAMQNKVDLNELLAIVFLVE